MILNRTLSDLALIETAEDILEAAQAHYVVLGATAKQIHDNFEADLEGPITLGMYQQDLTESCISALKSILPDIVITPTKISFQRRGIDVTIRILKRRYEVFKYPDYRMFKATVIPMPNPFTKYWTMRNLIQ